MKYFIFSLLLFFGLNTVAQTTPAKVNEQRRFNSDSRLFYVWNPERDAYDLKDTEYESSVIDIREINTKSNGYIVISLTDDGKTRLYHGSIVNYSIDDEGVATWILRSKSARGKVALDPKKKKITYSFESNETRYVKIFVFNLFFAGDENPSEQSE
ncbi:hypothetical protein G4D82_08010 [Flavobacterium sp. CYK-4]|uniref:hypothetical protein n=1 Tax=Flavobacterium lotistagni TaxID=2709660 RepID=UPI001408FA6B|nr:hypothetical protein [Flavobacterium lotistagni]NHM07163.1 hypothetical protein [Flavobacterium lotistagni]